MLLDARTLSDKATLSADICIVGAGAAGITLALKCRESFQRVLLLDGGGLEPSPAQQALYDGDMVGLDTWSMSEQRVRAFGGTTWQWAGWCMPLNPDDFEARDYLPESGWPITYDDVARYYPDAASLLEIPPVHWRGDALARADATSAPASLAGRLETRVYRFSPPTRFGQAYRGPLANAENVRVYYHANITGIELNQGADRVTHLEGQVLEGARFTVTADRYVLCLGGIENARLLLASRERDQAGVANSSDLVGCYFMEHPHIYTAAGWLVPEPAHLDFFGGRHSPTAGGDVLGVLALTADVRRIERLLDCTIQVSGAFDDQAKTPSGSVPVDAVMPLLRSSAGGTFRRLNLRAEQSPTRESRITLGTRRDPLGLPRPRLDWRLGPNDLITYGRAVDVVGSELAAAGWGRTWRPPRGLSGFDWYVDTGGHHMGTTRMGHSPVDGVVDGNCRTFDVSNLYVCGSSVFRTAGSANPTLTIVALACRLADHLASKS